MDTLANTKEFYLSFDQSVVYKKNNRKMEQLHLRSIP